MKVVPEDYRREGEFGISNFDCVIPDGAEEFLRNNKAWVDYCAWEFFAKVWFEDGKFYSEVMRYCSHIDTVEADTLHELFTETNNRHGWE